MDIIDNLDLNVGFAWCLILLSLHGFICRFLSVFFLKRIAGTKF